MRREVVADLYTALPPINVVCAIPTGRTVLSVPGVIRGAGTTLVRLTAHPAGDSRKTGPRIITGLRTARLCRPITHRTGFVTFNIRVTQLSAFICLLDPASVAGLPRGGAITAPRPKPTTHRD